MRHTHETRGRNHTRNRAEAARAHQTRSAVRFSRVASSSSKLTSTFMLAGSGGGGEIGAGGGGLGGGDWSGGGGGRQREPWQPSQWKGQAWGSQ